MRPSRKVDWFDENGNPITVELKTLYPISLVCPNSVRVRLKAGWTVSQALFTPPREQPIKEPT